MKKKNLISYSSKGYKFEIIIREENWRKVEVIKCDENAYPKTLYYIWKKYGVNPLDKKEAKKVDWLARVDW